ncbi:hypothetical protein [Lignipirellula cremea]|uniref:Uncharacterized protein n=1 Tax=Lignipirellula cremea TaxID=2528010 RepID=A0A518DWF1_9BACT|nr:hypothetical protein [Lignipirellula cremea]QDU96158.1 hypothetical protein Pla8534_39770 [Lignipirellula cremea]
MARIVYTAPLFLWGLLLLGTASAQQINISTPYVQANDSFYENIGGNFNFFFGGGGGGSGSRIVGIDPFGNLIMGGAIPFTQNSAGSAIPPFGGYNPGANGNLGIGAFGNGVGGLGNLSFSQGSQRSLVSQTPNVTIMNGGTGTFIDTSQTPFVTGVVPVVGRGYVPVRLPAAAAFFPPVPSQGPSPLDLAVQRIHEDAARGAGPRLGAPQVRPQLTAEERAAARVAAAPASSAEHGDLSVAAIKLQRANQLAEEAAAEQAEIEALVEKARGAVAAGKAGVARIYYRQAATRATGETRSAILSAIEDLGE